jgi:superfamily II DNA or RNA helicase
MKQLRSYQAEAVNIFSGTVFFCLNFACGLGKTLTAGIIAQRKKLPTLIIAPNALCEQWRDELIELGVDPSDIFIANAPEEHKNTEAYAQKFNKWLVE